MLRGIFYFVLAVCAMAMPAAASAERVRDLGTFDGLRSNQVTGYGVVVGLQGTGDNNLEYVTEAMRGVSGRLGLQLPAGVNPSLKNAAAVIITADLPVFAKPGQRIDITVSTIGQASSLRGGALVLTPLYGADGQIYAMAQGNVAVGGLGVSGRDGSQLTVNVATVGRIPDGATVERSVATGFSNAPTLRFNLHNSDFLTAARVRDAINDQFPETAIISDGVSIEVSLPANKNDRAARIAKIEILEITPAQTAARVIVNSRTGTVVINQAVRLSPAAISHGRLTIRINEAPQIVQPEPFSEGQTALEESSEIAIEREESAVALIPKAASLNEIVDALNLLGVGAADLVVILESLKQAGALKAEMVVL